MFHALKKEANIVVNMKKKISINLLLTDWASSFQSFSMFDIKRCRRFDRNWECYKALMGGWLLNKFEGLIQIISDIFIIWSEITSRLQWPSMKLLSCQMREEGQLGIRVNSIQPVLNQTTTCNIHMYECACPFGDSRLQNVNIQIKYTKIL